MEPLEKAEYILNKSNNKSNIMRELCEQKKLIFFLYVQKTPNNPP
jgi:hypothetical protein